MPVPKVVEEHVEIAKFSLRDRVQQRLEEQSVGRERSSERGVEQVVDVPVEQMAEVSQYPGDTVEAVELRKMCFERYTAWDAFQAAFNEVKTLISVECGLVEGVN